jgi:alkylation response protein AidB-like acyl-CoA dehydrogenase
MAAFGVHNGSFMVAHTMVGPAILEYGTEEQKDRFIPAMLRGDEVWCQLFSEPGSGSDLASLSTRATRDGDEWVVNGQKVWTSAATDSQWGILLARTDLDAPKHRGITYFLLDMATPGIDIRPLRQMTGESHFSEVFLTDVRVPADRVLGGEPGLGQGWRAAIHTLANERAMIGSAAPTEDYDSIVALARAAGLADDPLVRQELADAYTRSRILEFFGFRLQTALSHGELPGPETSVVKLFFSNHVARVSNIGLDLQGPTGALLDEGASTFAAQRFLYAPSLTIAGGTSEVQRNIIGERALGLPPEPRPPVPSAVVDGL